MPHQLVRQANGTFTFSEVAWNERIVGDDETNPFPSFVDHEITSIFFYRNRMDSCLVRTSFWVKQAIYLTSGIHQLKQL